jgi:hypothetical protein
VSRASTLTAYCMLTLDAKYIILVFFYLCTRVP